MPFADVDLRGKARHQNVGLAFGIDQMSQVAWMYDVEDPVAHDYFFGAGARTDDLPEFFGGLDLVAIFLRER